MEPWDAYFKTVDSERRLVALAILKTAETFLPPEETSRAIKYGVPTLQYKGESIMGVAPNNTFFSIYPFGSAAVDAIKPLLDEGVTTSKGAIQFPYSQLPSADLLSSIVDIKLGRNK